MKPIHQIVVTLWTGVLAIPFCGSAQPFQNLSFEGPILPLVPNDPLGADRVPISQAMPGWSAYLGVNALDLVLYNRSFLSSANVSLFGPTPPVLPFPGSIMEGRYTAFLQSGHGLGSSQAETYSASLAQVGLVPDLVSSVQMKIRSIGPFSVFLGGQELEMLPLQQGPNYTLYGGDASAFAGQVAELRITSDLYFSPTIGGFSYMFLDSIVFSPEVVPEPTPWTLLGLGGLLAAWFGRRALGKRVGRPNPKSWQEDFMARI